MNAQNYIWLAIYIGAAWVLFSVSYGLAVLTEKKKPAKETKKVPQNAKTAQQNKHLKRYGQDNSDH